MKVFVTGGSGLVGSTLIDLLLARGDEVLAIDNFATGRRDNLQPHARLRLVEDKEEDAKARIKALREAARIGIADIEGGRYRTFDSAADVDRHLETVRDRALAKKPAR